MKKLIILLIFFLLPLAFAQDNSQTEGDSEEAPPDTPPEDLPDEKKEEPVRDETIIVDPLPEDNTEDHPLPDPIPEEDFRPQECEGLTDEECEGKFRDVDDHNDFREDAKDFRPQECEGLTDEECEKLFMEKDEDFKEGYQDDFRPQECEGLTDEECKERFNREEFKEEHKEEVRIPEGCRLEESEFGSFVTCEKQRDFKLDDIERKCKEHGGNFHLGEFGPECIFEKSDNFFREAQCPDESFLREDANRCSQEGGKPEKFRDDAGCPFVSCNYENFERERQEEFDRIEDKKERFFKECEAKNGRPTILKGQPHCFTPEEKVRIRDELKPLEATDLLKIALKLENVVQSLTIVGDNFKELQKFYDKRGDDKKAATFERAVSKIDGAIDRLDEIRNDIGERAGEITEEDRINVLRDIQHVKNLMQDIAVEILTGKSIRDKGDYEEDYEGREEDFMEKIRHCDDFSRESQFSFKPDEEFDVSIYGDDGNCIMTINSDFTGEVKFTMPPKVYQFFRDPEQLFEGGVECSPKDNCEKMKRMLSEEKHDDANVRVTGEGQNSDGSRNRGPSAGPRSKYCEDNDLSNEDCYDWTVENIGLPGFCRDMSEEKCRTFTIEGWDGDLDERRELDDAFERQEFGDDITGRAIDRVPPECRERGLSPEECKRAYDRGEIRDQFEDPRNNFEDRRDQFEDNREDFNQHRDEFREDFR
jgi:hypothetical protein